ncbi:MAG: LacI family DNA-binding transcriptional regulator, partial [Clostridia bacterium]|nr:LacI family DNA-binding transcriptional regulator [Clostridia bacterium]
SMDKKSTIRDVARLAQVSVATAGRILGQYGSYSEESSIKVRRAAKQLGYVPNMFARNLKNSHMNVIGVVLSDIRNPFHSFLLSSIENHARSIGYTTMVCNSDDDMNAEADMILTLANKGADGIILASSAMVDTVISPESRLIYEDSVPIVLVDRGVCGINRPIVRLDNEKGGYDCVDYLTSLGHSKIGLVMPSNTETCATRVAGCRKAFSQKNIPFDDDWCVCIERKREGIVEYLDGWIDRHPELTAFIALNNLALSNLMYTLKKRGVHVPDDYSIMSWDDSDIARHMEITTVLQPIDQMGGMAVDMLFDMMKDDRVTSRVDDRVLTPRILERKSCIKLE